MDKNELKIFRSKRKTISLQVTGDGIIIRAPLRMSEREIMSFAEKHREWIRKRREKIRERENIVPLTIDEINELADRALKVIPERVRYYAPLVGVTYGNITIRNQRTRWGSCSSKGNLNFNCALMLAPPEAVDSVVVHELCHRKEMNHSEKFYAEVLRVFPEYRKWNKWLKDNGGAILRRVTPAQSGEEV